MTQSTSTKPESAKFFDDGQIAEWISNHGKNVVYALIATILILAIFYRLSNSYSGRQEEQYLQAYQDFTIFSHASTSQDPTAGTDALERLTAVLSAHPELHAAYDGQIAQLLLNRELITQAEPYILSTLSRTRSDDLPLYSDFSSATLLIAQGQFQQALDKSKSLQQNMIDAINSNSERNFGDELFAYNLFRIGMLEQHTGDAKGELQTWQDWMQFAGLQTANTLTVKIEPRAFRNVIQHMAVGSFSLPDYIAYRINELKVIK